MASTPTSSIPNTSSSASGHLPLGEFLELGVVDSIELTPEAELDPELRWQAGDLLETKSPRPYVAERGWTQLKPAFRVLALKDGRVVATRATCEVPNDEGVSVAGFGDMLVRHDFRGKGLARQMTRLAVDDAHQHEFELMLTATEAMKTVYLSLGFKPAEPENFLIPNKRELNWLALWRVSEQKPLHLHTAF